MYIDGTSPANVMDLSSSSALAEEEALSSNNAQQMSMISRKRQQHKQTYPLRIRKNQSFPKGQDCSSIPSQSVTEKPDDSSVFYSEAPVSSYRDGGGCAQQAATSSLQENIIQDYEEQIVMMPASNDASGRNNQQLAHDSKQSELAQA